MKRFALLLVLLLTLSGCGSGPNSGVGPSSTSDSTSVGPATPSCTPTAPIANPTDESREYATETRIHVNSDRISEGVIERSIARTQTILGPSSVRPRLYVYVRDSISMTGRYKPPEPYRQLTGRGDSVEFQIRFAGRVRYRDAISVNERILNRSGDLEQLLAHEYIHVLQYQQDAHSRLRFELSTGDVPWYDDREVVYNAIIEGPAVATEQQYAERYLGGCAEPLRRHERAMLNSSASPESRLLAGQYYYGGEYVSSSDPSGAYDRIYDAPPRSSEELIHGLDPNSTTIPPIRLELARGFFANESVRIGELGIRSLLLGRMEEPAALTASRGWGNDHLVSVTHVTSGRSGYVWITYWDSADDATQFQQAIKQYADHPSTGQSSTSISIARADSRVVAVYFGDDAFVSKIANSSLKISVGQK